MSARWQVVGCRKCSALWIVDARAANETTACPRCDSRYPVNMLRAKAAADARDQALELRSMILADRAGERDRYERVPHYAELADQAEAHLERYDEVFADGAEAALGFGDDWAEPLVDAHFERQRSRFESAAERALGRFDDYCETVAEAHLDSSIGGVDVDVDWSNEPSAVTEGQGDGRIRPVLEAPQDPDVQLDVTDRTPAEVCRELLTDEIVEQALVEAVNEITTVPVGPSTALSEAGVTAASGAMAPALAGLAQPSDHQAHQDARDVLQQIGQDGKSQIGDLPLSAARDGPLSALAAAGTDLTVAVEIDSGFRDRDRGQREDIMSLLAWLGAVADVHVVTPSQTAHALAKEHRDTLPSEFSEQVSAGRGLPEDADAKLREAWAALNVDGCEGKILRALYDEGAEALPRSALNGICPVTPGMVSQAIGTLKEQDLVADWRQSDGKYVELRPLGRELVEQLDERAGRQATLDQQFSADSEPDHTICREDTRAGAAPEAAPSAPQDRHRCSGLASVRRMTRSQAAAAAGTARTGGIRLLDHPIEEREDRREPWVRWDAERGEAVVSVEHDNPMQEAVSTSRGLASRDLLWSLLSPDRLEEAAEEFLTVLAEHKDLLRDASCDGWLPDDVEGPEDLQDQFADARDHLLELTRDLRVGEYADRDRFRGEITRDGLGLTGTMLSVFEDANVDVSLEVRVPRFRRLTDEQREDFAAHLAKTVAINSRIKGQFAAYRALFESRDDKREMAHLPTPDSSSRIGRFLANLVVVGDGVEDLAGPLKDALASPAEPHEDAPEFGIDVPVSVGSSRPAYQNAVSRACWAKRLRATDEATALLQATTATPYDAVEALDWLSEEETAREIRLDEVRKGLAHLDPDRLLPGTTPTVKQLFHTLLRCEQVLTPKELRERADVAESSFWDNIDQLVATGLVQETAGGYRIGLPFAPGDDRGDDVLPRLLEAAHAAPQDMLFDLAMDLVDDLERLTDREYQLARAFEHPWDPGDLVDALPAIEPWLAVARALAGVDDEAPDTVRFGTRHWQVGLADAVAAGGVPADD